MAPKGSFTRFTDAEREYIQRFLPTQTHQEIAEALGRDWKSVARCAARNGWSRRSYLLWTKEQEQYVLDHYQDQPYSEIALVLGKDVDAVRGYALNQMGLSKDNRRPWTDLEDEFLRENSNGLMTHRQMGEALNRSWQAIGQRVRALGLVSGRIGGYWTEDGHVRAPDRLKYYGAEWAQIRDFVR
jgi:hypothetical protein